HSKINEEWLDFEKWVEYTKSEVILVSGNHDIIPKYLYEDLGVKVFDELLLDGVHLTHQPSEIKGTFNFSGHVQPGIRMKGVGRQFLKFRCFYKTENQLILPAFGNFTGKYILTPSEMDEVYAIVEGEVICVSEKLFPMKKTLQIANIIAFIITVFVNYLGSSGALNGMTMGDISDPLKNLFTPASYAFSI